MERKSLQFKDRFTFVLRLTVGAQNTTSPPRLKGKVQCIETEAEALVTDFLQLRAWIEQQFVVNAPSTKKKEDDDPNDD